MRGRRFNSIHLLIYLSMLSACVSGGGSANFATGVEDQDAVQKTADGVIGSQPISLNITLDNVRGFVAIFPGEENGKTPFLAINLEVGETLPSSVEIRRLETPKILENGELEWEYREHPCDCEARIVRVITCPGVTETLIDQWLQGENFLPEDRLWGVYQKFSHVLLPSASCPGAEYRDIPVDASQRISLAQLPVNGPAIFWLSMLPTDPALLANLGPSALNNPVKIGNDEGVWNNNLGGPAAFLRMLRVTAPIKVNPNFIITN